MKLRCESCGSITDSTVAVTNRSTKDKKVSASCCFYRLEGEYWAKGCAPEDHQSWNFYDDTLLSSINRDLRMRRKYAA